MSCKCCWFHVRMIFSILLSVKIHCMFSYLMLKETDEASETDLAVIFINNPQAVWVSAFIFTVVTLSDYIFILNSEVDYFPHFSFYHRFFGSRKTSSFQPKVFRSHCFFRLCKVIKISHHGLCSGTSCSFHVRKSQHKVERASVTTHMTLIMSDAAWEAMVGGRWVAKWDARLIFLIFRIRMVISSRKSLKYLSFRFLKIFLIWNTSAVLKADWESKEFNLLELSLWRQAWHHVVVTCCPTLPWCEILRSPRLRWERSLGRDFRTALYICGW